MPQRIGFPGLDVSDGHVSLTRRLFNTHPAICGTALDGSRTSFSADASADSAIKTLAHSTGKLTDEIFSWPVPRREYTLLVDTKESPTAGTSGEAFVQLLGTRGRTSLIRLKRGFAEGTRKEFALWAKDVGKVKAIRLVLDSDDMWYVDRMIMVDELEHLQEFPVGIAVGWPNNPEVTVGPSFASMGTLELVLPLAATTGVLTLATSADVAGQEFGLPSPPLSVGTRIHAASPRVSARRRRLGRSMSDSAHFL